jgi:ABC-type Fe3+ transport system permease subunit
MKDIITNNQMSIYEIISRAKRIYSENFNAILYIILIIYIPINIVLALIPVEDYTELNTYLRVFQMLEGLIGIIATMAIAFIVKHHVEGKKIGHKEALKESMQKWLAALGTSIIMGIFLFLLALLLIIPAIIFYVYWIFAIYVVLFYNKVGKKALDYSKEIVKGRWWTVFGYSLIFSIIGFLLAFMIGLFEAFIPSSLDMYSKFTFLIIIYTVIDIVLAYMTVVLTIFFLNFDATKKKEIISKTDEF